MKKTGNQKIIAMAGVTVFLFSMLPIWYLAFYARPSGDDYGYSVLTHAAWLDTHSLWEVCKAGAVTVKNFYREWNGDWFSTFIFSLMPEVFAPWTFWIGAIVMTLLLIVGTTVFCYEMMVRTLHLATEDFVLLDVLILFLSFQFIPSTAIGMYWYVGAVHYIMPHAAVLIAIALAFRFLRNGNAGNIVGACFCAVVVGGSSYFASLLLFMVYFVLIVLAVKKHRNIVWLGLPFVICFAGFVVQCLSPGNAVRGGADFGFHWKAIVETILLCFVRSIEDMGTLAKEKMLVYSLLIVFAVIGWKAVRHAKSEFRYPYPLLFVIFMYGCYSAMYAPEIYAGVEVSKGPATIEYLTFLLAAGAAILYVEGWFCHRNPAGAKAEMACKKKGIVLVVIVAAGMFPSLAWHGWFRSATDVRIWEYVSSGRADDFKDQMEAQMEVFLDDSVKEAYVVPASDDQGPLMHMPLTEDEDAFTNTVVKNFYRKDKVVVKAD